MVSEPLFAAPSSDVCPVMPGWVTVAPACLDADLCSRFVTADGWDWSEPSPGDLDPRAGDWSRYLRVECGYFTIIQEQFWDGRHLVTRKPFLDIPQSEDYWPGTSQAAGLLRDLRRARRRMRRMETWSNAPRRPERPCLGV